MPDSLRSVVASRKDNSELKSEDRGKGDERSVAEVLNASRNECQTLQSQVASLTVDLREAQDFIFSRISQQHTLTETEATKDFSSLCHAVEDWVDSTLGDIIEGRLVEKLPIRETILLGTDAYNVTAAVMMFLHVEVFEPELYGVLTIDQADFLSSIETSMRNMVPVRGASRNRTWHSSTYAAIANLPSFESSRKKRIDDLSNELASLLRLFDPPIESQVFQSMIRTSIVERAVSLAHKMFLSADIFTFGWTSRCKLQCSEQVDITSGPLKDLEAVNFLAAGKTVKILAEGEVMTYLFDMSPQLSVRAVRGGGFAEPKVLKKSKVLGAVVNPGEMLKPEFRLEYSSLFATPLGRMEIAVQNSPEFSHYR
ncbi:hypothetical protein IFR05_009792 [Cadophora sp. M221]|nr:hypothetical protein IFR05_009792 [Cadophora sp. M221]